MTIRERIGEAAECGNTQRPLTRSTSTTPKEGLAVKATLEERFWAKVVRTDTCWLWTACVDSEGYGRFWTGSDVRFGPEGRRTRFAHRIAFVLVRGAIPTGMTLDHLCRNTRCVNPDHLDPCTAAENGLRGNTYQGNNARRTDCLRGHPLSGANLYVDPKGSRRCRTCKDIIQRAARERTRVAHAGEMSNSPLS